MTSRLLPVIALATALLVAPGRAPAVDMKFDFGTPMNTTPALVQMKFMFPPAIFVTVSVVIPPGVPAWLKRDLIQSALAQSGFVIADSPPGVPTFTIKFLPKGTRCQFVDHGTAERPDKITLPQPAVGPLLIPGTMDYGVGHFDPFDPQNQPAIFTAGIVTDVGELSVQVTAAELNFQTDGPIICQALFQRLAPLAPQYGAQINYAGDRLEVYFDPAYTVTQGGIIFGNTSRQGESGATLFIPPPANPPPVEFKFSLPITPVPAQLMLNFTIMGSGTANVPVMIEPGNSVLVKRDKAVAALNQAGAPAGPSAPDKCVAGNLAPGSPVRVTDMGSCEASDSITCQGTTNATAGFPGFFDPFAPGGQPAIFTAGIVTDVGELSAQVSSQELNFQTDGPIICQALFQRLAPRAPQYGAQLNYAGDRLEVYFDPAYTVTQGGIIFGTSSPSPGNFGEIILPPPAPPLLPGDMNCDGEVNSLDIQPFLAAVTSAQAYAEQYPGCDILSGDMNGDGVTDFLDLDQFVQTVINGG